MLYLTPGLAKARIRMAGYFCVENLDAKSITVLGPNGVVQLLMTDNREIESAAVDELLFRFEGEDRRALTVDRNIA